MATALETFDPATEGLRVSKDPIRRKQRRPSSKPAPRPNYANAVWYSFQHDHPLEAIVPVRAVEDTVRALKRAARYLERTESKPGSKVEVRVQISVEPLDDEPGKPRRSVVKFLGHKPWMLGRRVSKEDLSAEPEAPARARHRRTTAGTREGYRQTALCRPVVRAVITPLRPLHPITVWM